MERQTETTPNFLCNTLMHVEIQTLENLGWDYYQDYKEIAKAQNISLDQAKEYLHNNYFATIEIDENFNTFTWKEHKRLNEFSNKEQTGDDQKTIQDVIDIYKADNYLKFESL